MSFFSSEYECKLDAKGRLVLPAKIKSNLPQASGNNIVVTRGFEPCLVIYPEVEWKKVFAKVSSLNEFNPEYRNFQRNFLRGFTDVELDSMGRFVIPKLLLKYANIDKSVVVVGMGNRVEVWDPESYEGFLIKDRTEFSNQAQKYLTEEGS